MNYLRSERSRSFYLFIRRVIKQIAVIIEEITFVNYVQNSIQHPVDKVNSKYRENYYLRKNGSTLKQCISYL
jgi:hypothetical protein